MRTLAAIFGLAVLASCMSTPTTSSPSPSTAASEPARSPSATPEPARLMGTALVPTLVPKAEFATLQITLDLPDRAGQPAEDRVWRAEPYVADAGYGARVASALGVSGAGVVGAAPGGGPAWRLWWTNDGVLAVNESTGEVLFFAGTRDDGPTSGGAVADPALALERLVRGFGSAAMFDPSPGYVSAFRGVEATAPLYNIPGGTWTAPGTRDAAVLFPRYKDPMGLDLGIYDTDEVGLFTTRLRPVGIVHRPLGRLVGGEIYPIRPFGEAMKELGAAPQRFLRLLSVAPTEALTLTIDPATAVHGHAWAQTSASDLRRAGRTLVPVWVFPATGRTASGVEVRALFTVDAVVPEMRGQPASGVLSIDADFLLREQLSQIGGHRVGLRDPQQVTQEFMGAGCTEVVLTSLGADRYSGTTTCNGRSISLTVSRAFPGLPDSIWYVSDSRK